MSIIVPNRIQPSVVAQRINLIDVSSANGVIDFKKVKEAGFEGVYVQASRYSSTRDGPYMRNVDGARDAGLRVGAYHFCSHDSDPEEQAEFFFRSSGGLGSKPGELPPMVDWEFCTPSKYSAHPQHCVDWLVRFARKANAQWYPDNDNRVLKRHLTIYTYPNYSQGHQPALSLATELSIYPLTFASYSNTPKVLPKEEDTHYHPIPLPWTKNVLWQYSGNGGLPVPGVVGACDRQLFNGSSGEWQDFLGILRPVHSTEHEDKQ